jgi:transposase-like protein
MLLLTKNASQAGGGQQQVMITRDVCPRCQSPKRKKNGHIHNGKQNHQCHDCGRQFVDYFEQHLVSADTRALIERLLVERLSLRGICRAMGVTLKWLLGFLVECFEALPDHLHIQPGSALHVMLFLENTLQTLFIFNRLRIRHCQRALLGYHYQKLGNVDDGEPQGASCVCKPPRQASWGNERPIRDWLNGGL